MLFYLNIYKKYLSKFKIFDTILILSINII